MSERLAVFERVAEPGKMQMTETSLHVSSFVIVKRANSILLVKAGENHPLPFRKGKLLLPGAVLKFGEHFEDAATRLLKDQLGISMSVRLIGMQSHVGNHWDICAVYQCEGPEKAEAKPPYISASYHQLNALPRSEMATDHCDVLDALPKL